MNNAELFEKIFGIWAEEFWAYPKEKMLDWIASDAPDMSARDTISRQDAINLLKKWSDGYAWLETETESAIRDFQQLPPMRPETSRIEKALHGKTAEEQYDFIKWLMLDHAMWYTDSRTAVIEWLEGEDNNGRSNQQTSGN